ncbi:FemAB family XrtA/PEP-CTERM system-associated protein [Thioalkalivibrio sp. ALJ16]|uniref:FemAB family XrtA/PEP-CTERM system-associated protein n=1 Tax=Thioalkalivibrio sp. ALJ16 TaxID=1158762 RepID=UPI0003681A0D|nr:FemAB family XrtA/PEP-CTERM system-associated protein [Thioalkalivibrio sp. ALJ16]
MYEPPEQRAHGSGALQIHTLTPADHDRWDAFVAYCPQATFFHRAGWSTVLEQAFGHETYFLYAEADGIIQGVLPLARIRSRLFGHSLSSLPFCVYGGIAAVNEAAAEALDTRAQALARSLGVDFLEYRQRAPRHTDWPTKSELYVTFRRTLDPDVEANMNAIPRKQRRMVRKGIKAGLVSEIERDIDRFYPIYAANVRRMGTPVFGRQYFRTLLEVFGDACDVLTVTHDGEAVASVVSFWFRDEVLPYYGGGTPRAREVAGYDFLYWELMRRACEAGYRVFDFGRSKRDTGSFSFKKNWGFEPQPLYYEYDLVRAREMPDVNPLNPKYRYFIKAWQSLPLPVANWLGPKLARSLG